MNFVCIENVPAFFQRVRSCVGEVTFIDEKGTARDLKQFADHFCDYESLLQKTRIENIEVHASCKEDRNRLIRYMMEMIRS